MWNTGIGFGLLSSNSLLFYNLISFIIAGVIFALILFGIRSDKFDKIVFSIIIGGALGNFFDRLIYSTGRHRNQFLELFYQLNYSLDILLIHPKD